jgi:hypothetical protein
MDETVEGFRDWVRNLHDVYLNAQTAWIASVFIPPSDIEDDLEVVGGSRRQRLARFSPETCGFSGKLGIGVRSSTTRLPSIHRRPSIGLDNSSNRGRPRGWFKRIRQVRDYMNHRDKRDDRDSRSASRRHGRRHTMMQFDRFTRRA